MRLLIIGIGLIIGCSFQDDNTTVNNQSLFEKKKELNQMEEDFLNFDRHGLPDSLTNDKLVWMEIHPIEDLREGDLLANKTILFNDGSLYYWNNRRRAIIDGEYQSVSAEPKWRLSAKIKQERVDSVRNVIDSYEIIKENLNKDFNTSELYFYKDTHLKRIVLKDGFGNSSYEFFVKINQTITRHIISEGVPYEQE